MHKSSIAPKLLLIILLSYLAACNSMPNKTISPTIPSNIIISTFTKTLKPTKTHKPTSTKIMHLTSRPTNTPTQTFTPTRTLAPILNVQFSNLELSNTGPYLSYFIGSKLILVDLDNRQKTEILFENDASFSQSPLDGLSPHARYFAYFRGGQ